MIAILIVLLAFAIVEMYVAITCTYNLYAALMAIVASFTFITIGAGIVLFAVGV